MKGANLSYLETIFKIYTLVLSSPLESKTLVLICLPKEELPKV